MVCGVAGHHAESTTVSASLGGAAAGRTDLRPLCAPPARCCCDANLPSLHAPPVRHNLHATLPVRASILSCMLALPAAHARNLSSPTHPTQHCQVDEPQLIVGACRHIIEWSRRGCCCGAGPAVLRLTGARPCSAHRTPLQRCAAQSLPSLHTRVHFVFVNLLCTLLSTLDQVIMTDDEWYGMHTITNVTYACRNHHRGCAAHAEAGRIYTAPLCSPRCHCTYSCLRHLVRRGPATLISAMWLGFFISCALLMGSLQVLARVNPVTYCHRNSDAHCPNQHCFTTLTQQ